MARDIPVGNGNLLITFDRQYRVRDLYYPRVGRHNHTAGHVQRFGVWADGEFAWIEDDGWERDLRYLPSTLMTDVRLRHEGLGLELTCHDAVDFHEPVYFRTTKIRDLRGHDRDVRVFFHVDLSIAGSPVGDTANYDPSTNAVVLYKDDHYFLLNACDELKCGIDHWAIGTKRVGGAEGTWRDAEDGELGRNAISQGSVDATIGFNLKVPANGETHVTNWIACGETYDDVRRLSRSIWAASPEKLMERTKAYWRLWVSKESTDLSPLPSHVKSLFAQSQLILRTQIDNGGAIIAANDTDIAHFAGDHYSYCWPRDGALVDYALVLTGQSELSRQFFRYCERIMTDDGYFLHKYTPEGRLASSWHPWMLDGARVLPIQQDETALVVWALRQHFETFKDVEFVKPLYRRLVTRPAQWMLNYRDENGLPQQSWDLWEERRGVHLFTVASTIAALRAAALFAEDFGEPQLAVEFNEGAETMLTAMKEKLWDPERRMFARMAIPQDDGGYRLDMTRDSANLALSFLNVLSPDDPMLRDEAESLADRLWVQTDVGGCARYEMDYYHQVEREDTDRVPGNPWVICTLWQAQHRLRTATNAEHLAEAMRLIDWATERAEASGVMAEQFDPYTAEPLSVSPLTWSHATYVIVVTEYLACLRRLRTGAKPVSVGT